MADVLYCSTIFSSTIFGLNVVTTSLIKVKAAIHLELFFADRLDFSRIPASSADRRLRNTDLDYVEISTFHPQWRFHSKIGSFENFWPIICGDKLVFEANFLLNQMDLV